MHCFEMLLLTVYVNSFVMGHNQAIVMVAIFTAFTEIEDSLACAQKNASPNTDINSYNLGNNKCSRTFHKNVTQ